MKIKLNKIKPRISKASDRLNSVTSWRDNRNANARGYNYEWQRERIEFLFDHPICVMCESLGVITLAKIVDHVTPHRGNAKLFWNRDNWQALCATCHSKHKQRAENASNL